MNKFFYQGTYGKSNFHFVFDKFIDTSILLEAGVFGKEYEEKSYWYSDTSVLLDSSHFLSFAISESKMSNLKIFIGDKYMDIEVIDVF
jgi:hypothetical protein